MEQQKWIGIDVAKSAFQAALVPGGATRSFPNNEQGAAALVDWAKTLPDFQGHIAMEATGIYSRTLAAILHDLKAHPAIINPYHIHAYGLSFGRRNKTDPIDARLITQFANERQPRLWEPPDAASEGLKVLLEQRESAKLEQDRMNKQVSVLTNPPQILKKRQLDNETYIKKLEAEIRKHERQNEQLAQNTKLLCTIPGVGNWTARALLACTNNLKDFTRRSVASYTGLAPCVYHSGTYHGGGHIPHTGPRLIKKYLYMAAQANTQTRMKDNLLAQHYQKLRANHKTGKQALCALMRKIILIARALIQTQKPYDPKIHGQALVEN
ncbi:MAG: IS110 family transposase [Acidobacteria bacterium]|nr:IS110 family transposase [Acidobacteriota bacterium]